MDKIGLLSNQNKECTNFISWIEIYPLDKVIHSSNIQAQMITKNSSSPPLPRPLLLLLLLLIIIINIIIIINSESKGHSPGRNKSHNKIKLQGCLQREDCEVKLKK